MALRLTSDFGDKESDTLTSEVSEWSLDLRELFDMHTLDKVLSILAADCGRYKRIYAGSSFCPNYFLNCGVYHRLITYCRGHNLKISLSVCVFSQYLVEKGMGAVRRLMAEGEGVIDELVVNDVGMLHYVKTSFPTKVVLGRLFFKDVRDGRFQKFTARRTHVAMLSHLDLMEKWQPFGIEIDPISDEIDLSTVGGVVRHVALNMPFCYMSFGNICRAASAFKPLDKKFRPSARCSLECLHSASIHTDRLRSDSRTLFVVGKTVYFRQVLPRFVCPSGLIVRRLYFPLQEFLDGMRGNET